MNYMAEGFEFVYDTELFGLQSRIQKEVNLGTRTPCNSRSDSCKVESQIRADGLY